MITNKLYAALLFTSICLRFFEPTTISDSLSPSLPTTVLGINEMKLYCLTQTL